MAMKIVNEDGTVSGAFINVFITLTYLVLIVAGIFDEKIADSLVRLKDLMEWFFTASFGIWSAKKIVETLSNKGESQ